jgi:hypothetical protein
MFKLSLVIILLAGCSISGFDKSRKIEYSCEHNGNLTLEWQDEDTEVELKKH